MRWLVRRRRCDRHFVVNPTYGLCRKSNMDQPIFACHANHEENDYATTGIVSVRFDHVDVDLLETAVFFGSKPSDVEEALPAVIVSRGMAGTSELLSHYYSPHPTVVAYLASASSPILQEDAALLRFSCDLDIGMRGVGGRHLRHREDRSANLLAENRMLRTALGIGTDVVVTPSVATAAVASIASTRPSTVPARGVSKLQPVTSSASAGKLSVPSVSKSSVALPAPRSVSPGVLNDEVDAETGRPPIHSPLQWDTETEAAINARTVYDPYGRRHDAPSRLDKVTQAHLVSRLHDKSCDQKQRRRAEIEERVMRSLGRQERRVLSPEEEHELGHRLHDQQREYSKKVMTKLKDTYLPVVERRTLTPDVMKASAVRMHDETMERAKKNLDALVDEYVYSRMPEKKKLDLATQQEMANRLCTPKAVS